MVLVLRIFRGVIGFFCASLVLQILLGLTALPGHPDPGKVLAFMLFKAIAAFLFGGTYYGTYRLINWLHRRNKQAPQPKLDSVWKL